MGALFGHQHFGGFAASADADTSDNQQLELQIGYGMDVFNGRFLATPEAGLGLSSTHRAYRLGWRLGLAHESPMSMELGLTGTRREPTDRTERPSNAVLLQGSMRW